MKKTPWKHLFLMVGMIFQGGCDPKEKYPSKKTKQLHTANLIKSVLSTVENEYVFPINTHLLEQNAIHGIMHTLDPYCQYFTEEEFQYIQKALNTKDGAVSQGTGLLVRPRTRGGYKVIDIFPGSIASDSMIQLGDIITHINDVPTHSIDNVHALLHENTSLALKLSMLRCSTPFILFLEKKPLEQNKSFHGYVRENVAVIQLGFIQKDSREKIESFLLSLKKQGIFQNIHGLLIDIRHNPGGRLDDAINILSLFLDHKLAYILQGKLKEDRQKIFTISHPLFLDIPMVVLADHLTASAAELMAGALQHHKRALLVGENTYGKNGIQSLFKMPGMGGIKVTTAYFLTPSGDNISKKGLTPNIAFKKDDHLPPTSPSIDPWQAQSIHLLHQLALKGAQS